MLLKLWVNFLGNMQANNYEENVEDKLLPVSISLSDCPPKCMLAFSLDLTPTNLDAVSDEHGEIVHQDISQMEKQYSGKWNEMLVHYCWILQQENSADKYKHKKIMSFSNEITNGTIIFF